jgi:hypothetical protein
MACSEIPYATEQGIISKKKANLIHEQGIFPVKFEIHCRTADLNRHRWPSWTRLEKVGPNLRQSRFVICHSANALPLNLAELHCKLLLSIMY